MPKMKKADGAKNTVGKFANEHAKSITMLNRRLDENYIYHI